MKQISDEMSIPSQSTELLETARTLVVNNTSMTETFLVQFLGLAMRSNQDTKGHKGNLSPPPPFVPLWGPGRMHGPRCKSTQLWAFEKGEVMLPLLILSHVLGHPKNAWVM